MTSAALIEFAYLHDHYSAAAALPRFKQPMQNQGEVRT